MSFNALCEKTFTDIFNPDKYQKLDSRKFFDFDPDAYKMDREPSQLVYRRSGASTDGTLDKTVKAEVKFGWMCGMNRDRLVQLPTNYSEIMRNNCVLGKDVNARLHEAYNSMTGG